MTPEKICPECGARLSGTRLGGLCHRCVGLGVFEPEKEDSDPIGPEADENSGSGAASLLSGPSQEPELEVVSGRYRLLRQIGEGGFGEVYLAEQIEPVKRQVALKILKLGLNTKAVVTRFESERQSLALMDHPNISKIHDAGVTSSGRPYFVMELVSGVKVTTYCESNQLSVRARLELFIKICQAVQHAHQKGIIHRDLKPSNILVVSQQEEPVPKVIDFGIAKAVGGLDLTDKTLFTGLQQFLGTPSYMSPEQLEMSGVDVDTRSDIYSLGVLLYELLTGSTPLDTTHLSYEQICRRIREEDPPKPSTRLKTRMTGKLESAGGPRSIDLKALRKQICGDLDQVVMKALDKDRTRRYETANALALDVSRYLHNEPVLAVAPSPIYRFRKLVRRNRSAFAAVAIVFLVLIVGAAVSTWQAVRATRSEREQSRLRREAQAQAYAADMNLAQQALSENNLGRTKDLLARHRPSNTSPDLRGWEWRYLWQQSQGGPRELLCQRSPGVFSLSFSADGRWAAVGERYGGLSVWDVAAKKIVANLWESAIIIRVAFSPQNPLLAFAVNENSFHSIFLWDFSKRKVIAEYPLRGPCMGLSFSGDGSRLISFTYTASNQISILHIPDGILLDSSSSPGFDLDWTGNLTAVTADFSQAAYRFSRNHIHVFDPATSEKRGTFSTPEDLIFSLAFSPDGKLLAAGTGLTEGAIHIWNLQSGQRIAHWKAHDGYITRLLFWPDGKTLASTGADQLIGLWDLSALPVVSAPRRLIGHQRPVLDLALLPDNTTLASSSEDGSVLLWDTSKSIETRTHFILTNTLVAWRFGRDSRSVLTVDTEGKVMEWRGPVFQDRRVLLDTGRETSGATISDDLRRVATSSLDGNLQVWDLAQGLLPSGYPPDNRHLLPRAFLEQGQRLILQDFKNSMLREWDLASGRELASWPNDLGLGASGLLSPKKRWLLRTPAADTILLTDRTSNQDVRLSSAIKGIQASAFSLDGLYLAVTSWRGLAALYETKTGRELATFRGFMMGVHSAAFSPDGKRLATTSTGTEAVRLWDLESYQEMLTLPANNATFLSTQFSPDGNLLGAMDYGAKLHIWSAPSWTEINAAKK